MTKFYTLNIQITQPDTIDTGYYYCFYSGAGNLATDTTKAAKTYVYVHGKICWKLDLTCRVCVVLCRQVNKEQIVNILYVQSGSDYCKNGCFNSL